MQAVVEIEQESAPSIVSRIEDGERVRVKIEGKEFVLISVEDLEFLESIENDLDLPAALKSMRESAKDKEFTLHEDVVQEILQSGKMVINEIAWLST